RDRLYVGGFSKGGWIASTLAEAYLPDLAGVILLGAGKTPFTVKTPMSRRGGRALYIGVGQLEINFPYGMRAIKHFSGLGFKVTFDGYPGLGHSIPIRKDGHDVFQQRSVHFLQWWDVERYRDSPLPLKQPVEDWFQSVRDVAENAGLPAQNRFLAIYRARRAPFHAYLTAEQRKTIEALVADFAKNLQCRGEIDSQRQFFEVVNRELGGGDFERLHRLAMDYHRVWMENPNTYHGALGGLSSARLGGQVRDIGNWRFSTINQKDEALARLQKNPIPKVARENLLSQIRDIEESIRIAHWR
ncbi:MAG: hypothetical protein AAGH89_19490, partial [Verrucomicrobiota bacterium]